MQIRIYNSEIKITDTVINITSTFSGGNQISTDVARDGSMDTNFKAACAAHRDSVLSLSPTSTSPPCYVSTKGKWIKTNISATVASEDAVIKVPTGNSGILVFHLDANPYTFQFSKNSGTWTTAVDTNTITVVNNDLLKVRGTGVAPQAFINGSITDQDTGVEVDIISLMNNTP